ncbi:uncharacterized protein YALI1_D26064g [Yarrowia lipolytica]|uniref:Uncharacterized protein n=1 Tax=Yarrowia lipolytica TaxID=4952 RepID=A0A1D8NFI0_YARLL|nr:hypothetical protein YALI1_D26064g [Yarrowia lipolytica]
MLVEGQKTVVVLLLSKWQGFECLQVSELLLPAKEIRNRHSSYVESVGTLLLSEYAPCWVFLGIIRELLELSENYLDRNEIK